MAGTNGQGARTRDAEVLPEGVPVSPYVYLVTKDDITFRGALVRNDAWLELRGAQVAEFADGVLDPRWKVLDGPLLVPLSNVSYLVERP